MDEYQKFIALSRYARWLPDEGRRETWEETVQRYKDFFWDRTFQGKLVEDPRGRYGVKGGSESWSLPEVDLRFEEEFSKAMEAVVTLKTMPSMRCLMTAGKALEKDNIAGFNCTYLSVDHPRAFDEMLYVLMCGSGVGYSVERQNINKLPEIAESFHKTETTIVVKDSKIGWAKAFKELISLLYNGNIPKWDVSKVRPAGAKLKTFGGRSSGPEPLVDLFNYSVRLFSNAAGRKLNSLECHDLCCKVADIVVVGGVRRSALISLSNLSDDRIRKAKSGQFWVENPERALANNSTCYTEKPDFQNFLKEWYSLYESKSGERGMFSRVAAKKQAAKNGRRDIEHEFGTNPCLMMG